MTTKNCGASFDKIGDHLQNGLARILLLTKIFSFLWRLFFHATTTAIGLFRIHRSIRFIRIYGLENAGKASTQRSPSNETVCQFWVVHKFEFVHYMTECGGCSRWAEHGENDGFELSRNLTNCERWRLSETAILFK